METQKWGLNVTARRQKSHQLLITVHYINRLLAEAFKKMLYIILFILENLGSKMEVKRACGNEVRTVESGFRRCCKFVNEQFFINMCWSKTDQSQSTMSLVVA